MLAGSWRDGHREALTRLARARGVTLVEHGALAVAGSALDVADAGDVRVIFSGRLAGAAPGGAAAGVLDRYARGGLAALRDLPRAYVAPVSDGRCAWVLRDRFGAMTLSYAAAGGGVAIGEHDADVLELLAATPSPSRLAVVQWLDRRPPPPGQTLFSGGRG